MNDLYGHFCDKSHHRTPCQLTKRKELGLHPIYCLFGLTVKFALTCDIHQDYKEF